ncbi:RNA-binding cell elongation regulator Jag/EloR [Fructilactobacillus sp. Tb1]|uniref:RNA-binding cell elongation regulator Jag/EloR n=1 Tax=Fructilactobacillus sp. Tb1 TaxID=3422304 RepID=UPI003D297E15
MPKYTGKNLETAIENGLKDLNINRKDAEIKIIQKPSKGFLGFFKKDAVIEMRVVKHKATNPVKKAAQPVQSKQVTKKTTPTPEKIAEDRFERNFAVVKDLAKYLQDVLDEMGINATLEVDMPNNKHVYIDCQTDKEGLLIGKHGRTINALQQLCEFYLSNHGVNYVEVVLDTANYRERRRKILTDLAQRTARDVEATGQPVHLDSMPSFERKQIHLALEGFDDVLTYSVGNEPNREVVIGPR